MFLLHFTYSKVLRRPTPYYFQQHSIPKLVWKVARKFLNVSVVPFVPFNSVRILLYRLVGYQIGRNVFIGMQCYLDDFYPEKVIIEDNVTISYRVTIATHGPTVPPGGAAIHFKQHSYVGAGSLILAGVTVGEHSIVAGGSVVVRSVPPETLVAGVPARKIKSCWYSN